jgi:hypothetical protein
MTIWWLGAILGTLGASGVAFIWLAVRLGRASAPAQHKTTSGDLITAAEDDVEHIFNAEFREELRNRGRLHFEKIIGENAMFLQQDLRLTTSQLNEYMKAEITKKLQEEFDKYEQSIMDAKQLAIDSIQKTNQAIEEQRQSLSAQVQAQIEAEKQQLIERFTANMTDIVNHYLNAAIGAQIDLSDQLPYIVAQMEANKAAILEDIERGA